MRAGMATSVWCVCRARSSAYSTVRMSRAPGLPFSEKTLPFPAWTGPRRRRVAGAATPSALEGRGTILPFLARSLSRLSSGTRWGTGSARRKTGGELQDRTLGGPFLRGAVGLRARKHVIYARGRGIAMPQRVVRCGVVVSISSGHSGRGAIFTGVFAGRGTRRPAWCPILKGLPNVRREFTPSRCLRRRVAGLALHWRSGLVPVRRHRRWRAIGSILDRLRAPNLMGGALVIFVGLSRSGSTGRMARRGSGRGVNRPREEPIQRWIFRGKLLGNPAVQLALAAAKSAEKSGDGGRRIRGMATDELRRLLSDGLPEFAVGLSTAVAFTSFPRRGRQLVVTGGGGHSLRPSRATPATKGPFVCTWVLFAGVEVLSVEHTVVNPSGIRFRLGLK